MPNPNSSAAVAARIATAVRRREAPVALAPRRATAGSFRRPAPKPLQGVSAAVRRRYGDDGGV